MIKRIFIASFAGSPNVSKILSKKGIKGVKKAYSKLIREIIGQKTIKEKRAKIRENIIEVWSKSWSE